MYRREKGERHSCLSILGLHEGGEMEYICIAIGVLIDVMGASGGGVQRKGIPTSFRRPFGNGSF